jgi:hypothetical protein
VGPAGSLTLLTFEPTRESSTPPRSYVDGNAKIAFQHALPVLGATLRHAGTIDAPRTGAEQPRAVAQSSPFRHARAAYNRDFGFFGPFKNSQYVGQFHVADHEPTELRIGEACQSVFAIAVRA